jgi:ubiquinol-cytochrome c reductase cytochrome c1 subunit
LIAAARPHGGPYVYSLLTGFYTDGDGNTDNHVFPGIVMPDVLGYSSASDDMERHELKENARDVAGFLVWATDPNASLRKRIGVGVIIYLVILTTLLYLWKRRIWMRLDQNGGNSV